MSNTLKKEFTRRDVQRMRNLITGNSGDKTHVQSGWEKYSKDRKEGDIWEELGKTWTIKNGIKQTITKLDSIKKLAILPLLCPNCKQPMRVDEFNKSAYSAKGMCLNCVVKEEDNLKINSDYEKVLEDRKKADMDVMIRDLEQALDTWYEANESFVSEQGDVENWSGGDKKLVYDRAKKELSEIKNT